MRKIHKKNKTFSTREHRTQNTRGGVVVTPPCPNQPTTPVTIKKTPWSTRERTLKENRTVYYSNAAPTVSAVQPVYQDARALPRGRNRTNGNARNRIEQHQYSPAKILKKTKKRIDKRIYICYNKTIKGGTKNVSIFKRLQRRF